MPQRDTAWKKMLDAIGDSNKALLDAVKSGNARGFRFSKGVVTEAQNAGRELTSLRRRFASEPKDPRSLYEAAVDLARRASRHSADIGKQLVEGVGDAGQEAGETAAKVIKANRAAAQAFATGVQQAARRVPVRRRSATAKGARRTTSGRTATKKAARSTKPRAAKPRAARSRATKPRSTRP
jgi:hypothetical protein